MSVVYVPVCKLNDTIYVLCNEQAIITGWRTRLDAKDHFDQEFKRSLDARTLISFYGESYYRVMVVDEDVLYGLISPPFNVECVVLTHGQFVGIPLKRDVDIALILWTTALPVRGTVNQDVYWKER